MRSFTGFPRPLGSADPCASAVHMEPFPSSAFKVPFFNDTATTEIYTNGRSTQAHALDFAAATAPSYSSRHGNRLDGRVWVARLSAIHFRG